MGNRRGMSQQQVTQFFASRKKTFEVLPPSKKVKLDSDNELTIKASVKSTKVVKRQSCFPVSVKRLSTKKRKQADNEGNTTIKVFFETTKRRDLSKAFAEKSAQHESYKDSLVGESDIKCKFKSDTDGLNYVTKRADNSLENEVPLKFERQGGTARLQTVNCPTKQQTVNITEDNMTVFESTIESQASRSKDSPKATFLDVNAKSSEGNRSVPHVNSDSEHKHLFGEQLPCRVTNEKLETKEIKNQPYKRESHPDNSELAVVTPLTTPSQAEKSVTSCNSNLNPWQSVQKAFKNCDKNVEIQHTAKMNNPAQENSSRSLTPENAAVKDKHTLLKKKIKMFKEAAKNVKGPSKAESKELPPETETKLVSQDQQFKSASQNNTDASLILPFKYKKLQEMFRAAETVVSMLYNRKEVCTFKKLKDNVQQLARCTFDQRVLGQIVTVYPAAYTFKWEKGITSLSSSSVKTSQTQLTVTPVLSSSTGVNVGQFNENSFRMNPSLILQRRLTFKHNLVNITKNHHKKFLTTLNPPIHVPVDEIKKWHPKFLVDDVPDIPVFPLPEQVEHKVFTAKDVLEKMHGIVNERIQKALQGVANEKPHTCIKEKSKVLKVASGPLKGISNALLDKIRSKQNAKIVRDMLRNPESEKRLEMLYRLPELVRILRTYFIVEKRAAIPLEDIKVKVCDSFHSPISPEDVEKLMDLLCPIVPEWIIYVRIPRGTFVKINMNINVNDIVKVIDAEILKEKS